jgi:hypothetical protein
VIAEEAFQVGFHRDRLDDWSTFWPMSGSSPSRWAHPGVGQG